MSAVHARQPCLPLPFSTLHAGHLPSQALPDVRQCNFCYNCSVAPASDAAAGSSRGTAKGSSSKGRGTLNAPAMLSPHAFSSDEQIEKRFALPNWWVDAHRHGSSCKSSEASDVLQPRLPPVPCSRGKHKPMTTTGHTI